MEPTEFELDYGYYYHCKSPDDIIWVRGRKPAITFDNYYSSATKVQTVTASKQLPEWNRGEYREENGEMIWYPGTYAYAWQRPKEVQDYMDWEYETMHKKSESIILRNVLIWLGVYFGAMFLISIVCGTFALL